MLSQSVKFAEERKTYDPTQGYNNKYPLNFNTLESLNQNHATLQKNYQSYQYENPNIMINNNKNENTTTTYTYKQNSDLQYLNEKYSSKEPPGNVQDIIDKIKMRKSYQP